MDTCCRRAANVRLQRSVLWVHTLYAVGRMMFDSEWHWVIFILLLFACCFGAQTFTNKKLHNGLNKKGEVYAYNQ